MGKRRCPQMCPFRQRAAPFCGFCMEKILQERTVQEKNIVREGDADEIISTGVFGDSDGEIV